ncbi:MBL fold metallo-hydrolase [Ensifer adhaerens]|uniref:MBL fold metallo-hydrolase n=1 Tax=Ensifer adhaerens TaxID=106592 RepID=A0A9Q9DEH5_ENSAD|nr:MBL fold metallo-hydrolase [Ensifer adhaerens]USJ28420.1 MBL fold metallo-hydrolase [Ensifer adhaerens]
MRHDSISDSGISRRTTLIAGLSALGLVASGGGRLITSAAAADSGPYSGTGVAASKTPAFFQATVGDAKVTALLDGGFVIPTAGLPKFFPDSSPTLANLDNLVFPHPDGLAIPVGAYLIETGRNTVLIDAGGGPNYLPTTGRLQASLAAVGVAPEKVDTILLTHMHMEHALGMSTADGKQAFPNAEVVVSNAEYTFWLDDANISRVPQGKSFVEGARRAVAPYSGRIRRFNDDRETEVVAGISTLPGPGHTPGNTSFLLTSGSQSMLIMGDVLHHPVLQLPTPRARIGVDVDPALGVESRVRTLESIAGKTTFVGGMHLPWPGFGRIARSGEGFAYLAMPWQFA